MQKMTVPFSLKGADEDGNFKGIASKFGNVDLGYDEISKDVEVSVKAGQNGRLKLALYHDTTKMAGNAAFSVDKEGLHVDGALNLKVGYVRDAYELMKDGTLDEMSIGFNITDYAFETRDKKEIRIIKGMEVWEASIVPFGMNPEAQITQVKSIRDFEGQLRELGFSKKEAKALASHGYKGLHRDDGNADIETMNELKKLEQTLNNYL